MLLTEETGDDKNEWDCRDLLAFCRCVDLYEMGILVGRVVYVLANISYD